jgi:hypothetical protein
MKMEESSETSAYKIQTPGNYPEENIQQDREGLQCCCHKRNGVTYYDKWTQQILQADWRAINRKTTVSGTDLPNRSHICVTS